jgi:hypothetical protein
LIKGTKYKLKAEFRCLKCGFEWKDKPGPTECRVCGHLYVKWVNYEEWRKWAEEKGYYDYQKNGEV